MSLSLSDNISSWLIKDRKYAVTRDFLATARIAENEYFEQNPALEWIAQMPLLERMFFELAELTEDLNLTIEQLKAGQVNRDLLDNVMELSDHRLNLEAFLKEQFEAWKRLSGHADTLITFDQLIEDVTEYRASIEKWLDQAMTKVRERD